MMDTDSWWHLEGGVYRIADSNRGTTRDATTSEALLLERLDGAEKREAELLAEVERLRAIEADYVFLVDSLAWCNIGTGAGYAAQNIGGFTWCLDRQIRREREAKAKEEKQRAQ